MSYREKPQLKLYKYENNSFVMQAQIDDYQECSFEDNLYEAGQFSITINFNIPNSQLFQRGLFIQFGSSWKFGEITKIQDQIGEEGKGSQYRIITGFDARYILKRRVIKNMNSNGLWVMTGKGEIVLRNLINDQAGTNAEEKRRLPITNTIPDSETAIGKEYSASEQFSNLYEVCKTIATQSEIGWRLEFNGTSLNLICFNGTDRTQTVQFSTSFDSLANGQFIDSSESFSNAIYVGGKGQNDDRDIYEGESAIEGDSPAGLDRFESWDNQSSMTTESEYEAEALSMLNQYGQTLTMSGNGLAKCPYEYEKEYFTGDKIKIAFSGKSANAQILSVTEHWAFGAYEINFSFGKPLPDLNAQLQLMLRKIQTASNKTNSKDSVRWYDIPTDTAMPASDVTYTHIGFIGNVGSGATFTLYRDSSGTGSKTYHVYIKQLGGSGKLTLTTGVSGASTLLLNPGTYVAIIYVDENGNITSQGMTATGLIESGNNQPATSDGVADAISSEAGARDTAIANALNLPTDAVLHYSFDDVPYIPDGTAVYKKDNNFTSNDLTDWFVNTTYDSSSIVNNKLKISSNGGRNYCGIAGRVGQTSPRDFAGKLLKIKLFATNFNEFHTQDNASPWTNHGGYKIQDLGNGYYEITGLTLDSYTVQQALIFTFTNQSADNYIIIEQLYIGNGSYSNPVIDNSGYLHNGNLYGGLVTNGVCNKGVTGYKSRNLVTLDFNLQNNFSLSIWVNPANTTANLDGDIIFKSNQFVLRNGFNDGTNRLHIVIWNTVTSSYNVIYLSNANVLLPANQWTHLVITKNGTSLKYYQNTVLKTSPTLSFSEMNQNDYNFTLHRGTSYARETSYDDLLIFNRALSAEEVQALYLNKANTPKYFNLNNYILDHADSTPTQNSTNPITSGGVYNEFIKYLKGDLSQETLFTGDLNDIQYGNYFVSSASTNLPPQENTAGFLMALYGSSTYQEQLIFFPTTSDIYTRVRFNGNWGKWHSLKNIFVDKYTYYRNSVVTDTVYLKLYEQTLVSTAYFSYPIHLQGECGLISNDIKTPFDIIIDFRSASATFNGMIRGYASNNVGNYIDIIPTWDNDTNTLRVYVAIKIRYAFIKLQSSVSLLSPTEESNMTGVAGISMFNRIISVGGSQPKTLSTPITIAGQSYTTVEDALQALAGLV